MMLDKAVVSTVLDKVVVSTVLDNTAVSTIYFGQHYSVHDVEQVCTDHVLIMLDRSAVFTCSRCWTRL